MTDAASLQAVMAACLDGYAEERRLGPRQWQVCRHVLDCRTPESIDPQGDARVHTQISTYTDLRLIMGLALSIPPAFAAVSTPASAGGCGMMKRPPTNRDMPMYRPAAPYGWRQPIPYGHEYGRPMDGAPGTIDIMKAAGMFRTLLDAIEAAGLTGLLERQGPYTLFAPTDSAFEKLREGALQELSEDKEKLVALLKYHLVPGRMMAAQILQSRELTTSTGQNLPTRELSVIRSDVRTRNGVIQVLDSVLFPSP